MGCCSQQRSKIDQEVAGNCEGSQSPLPSWLLSMSSSKLSSVWRDSKRVRMLQLPDSLSILEIILSVVEWSKKNVDSICLCKLVDHPSTSHQSLTVTHCLIVKRMGSFHTWAQTWSITVSLLTGVWNSAVSRFRELLMTNVCAGYPDERILMVKAK